MSNSIPPGKGVTISPGLIATVSLLLAMGGALAGGAIAWGAMSATVNELRTSVTDLSRDVGTLRSGMAALQAELAEERGRREGFEHHQSDNVHEANR